MGAAATPVTNHREAGLALRELRSAGERIAAELIAVEDSPGRRFLDGANLSGVTLARWTAAKAAMDALWAHYALFQQVLATAEGTRDLARLTTLLRGPAVSLPDLRQVTMVELLEIMTASCREVWEVVSAADAAWSQVAALDHLDARLRAATAMADELGVAGPSADTLAAIRTQVLSDPLSLSGNDNRLAEVDTRLAEATVELTALRRLHDEAEPRLAALRESVHDLAANFDTTRQLVATAQDKIAGSLVQLADPVPSLRLRVDALARTRDLARLARGIEDVTRAITTAAGQLAKAAANAQELLDRRAELRGRLDAYRVKAARLGHSEDPALADLHRQARDLLWHAPCDLAASTRALNAYQRAISDKEAAR